MKSLAKALVNATHNNVSSSIMCDIHILLVMLASRLLESPRSQFIQADTDLHVILNLIERKERTWCGIDKACALATRSAQVALFERELDIFTRKVSNQSGFNLRTATSYYY